MPFLLLLWRQLCSAIQSLARRLFMDMAKNENDTPELVDYKLRVYNGRADGRSGQRCKFNKLAIEYIITIIIIMSERRKKNR